MNFDHETVTVTPFVNAQENFWVPPVDDAPEPVFDTWLTLKVTAILTLIAMIVVGNGMVMLAVRLDRSILALSQSSFLFSMALADALVGIFVIPMALLQIVYRYWPLPPVICILYRCLDVALCTASILHLCAISMDRYWSLRIDYTRHHRARNMRIMIIVVWLLSFIICLPSALPSKFDLQYLGNYLANTRQLEALQDRQNIVISPFYILDSQPKTTVNPLQTATVYYTPSSSLAVSLPDRPRGNNKILQAVEDVGSADCAGPSPFDWLFAPANYEIDYSGSMKSKSSSCNVHVADASSANSAAVLGDRGDSDADSHYHCALINDIFYTFASASMSFYIPLVITIVMNILTYWVAQKTAKAAIKRLHATNPAALMLRAVIPMPINAGFNDNSETNTPLTPMTFGTEQSVVMDNATNYHERTEVTSTVRGNHGNHTTTISSAESHTDVQSPLENLKVSNGVASTRRTSSSCNRGDSFRYISRCRSSLEMTTTDANECSEGPQRYPSTGNKSKKRGLVTSFLRRPSVLKSRENSVVTTTGNSRSASVHHSHRGDRDIYTMRMDRKRKAKQRERKAALVLIIVTVTFIVCWLPFFTVFPLTKILDSESIPDSVFEASVWLGYVNSAVNPIIYTIFNEEFRRAFTMMFLCKWTNFGRY